MSERRDIGVDVEFIKHLKKHGGETMKKCYQCATCSVVCQLSPEEYAFPRKEMIQAAWGQKEKLLSDADIWLCHGCMDCSLQCPRGARPADLMGAVRSFIYQKFSFPRFMGKAMANPKALPWLFLFAMFMVFLMVLATNAIIHGFDGNFFAIRGDVLKYEDFIHKLVIEGIFIPGNLLIFGLAYIGLSNYWKSLKENNNIGEPQYNFVGSAWRVFWDFLAHRKFEKCPTNSNRRYGHIYAFYGFVGTMIATGLVVVGEVWHYGHMFHSDFMMAISFYLPYPMGLLHPVKILGVVSGLFLVIGLVLFLMKRYKTDEQHGKSSYNDWLFLWVILGVGITGMAIVFLRMSGVAVIAYITYFIHLTLVFFLLWYMPYSKFAHMLYRFLGLTFLKMHGRENKPEVFKN
ncbi:MAG: quinone-interacting membrane-bound oxidoreductase complex subunit QmoC [bacterium]